MQENRDYDFRENANKRLLKTWDTLLQDFQSIEHSIWGGNRINIPDELEKQFNTRHILMVFVTVLGYFYEYQPVEKVEWFITLKYKGVVFQMGNMKYGFRIFVFDREIDDDIVKEF